MLGKRQSAGKRIASVNGRKSDIIKLRCLSIPFPITPEFDRREIEVIPPQNAKNTAKRGKSSTSSLVEAKGHLKRSGSFFDNSLCHPPPFRRK
jgi:hypothetical protein